MDQFTMTKQVLDLQKATFEGMTCSMLMFWEQTEKIFDSFLDQAVWLPEEGRKAFSEWIKINRKGYESFRNTLADSLSNVGSCFIGAQERAQP